MNSKLFKYTVFAFIAGAITYIVSTEAGLALISFVVVLIAQWYFDPDRIYIRIFFMAFSNLILLNKFTLSLAGEIMGYDVGLTIGDESWHSTVVFGVICVVSLVLHYLTIHKHRSINDLAERNTVFKNKGDSFNAKTMVRCN